MVINAITLGFENDRCKPMQYPRRLSATVVTNVMGSGLLCECLTPYKEFNAVTT